MGKLSCDHWQRSPWSQRGGITGPSMTKYAQLYFVTKLQKPKAVLALNDITVSNPCCPHKVQMPETTSVPYILYYVQICCYLIMGQNKFASAVANKNLKIKIDTTKGQK